MAKFFQIFFDDQKKNSTKCSKNLKNTKNTIFEISKVLKFWIEIFEIFDLLSSLSSKKNWVSYDFFETFFTYSEAYELSEKYMVYPRQNFSIYRKIDLKFSRFRIFGVLGVRLTTSSTYISQNTRWSGSTYRGDGFLRQGFQNAPSARKRYLLCCR